MAPTAQPAEVRHIDAFGSYLASFEIALQAENRSVQTIRTYRWGLLRLRDWLAQQGRPTDPTEVTRNDIRGFMADMLGTHAETSVAGAFAGIHRFFTWLAAEEPELLPHSPTEGLHAPKLHDKPVTFLSDAEIVAMLKACAGADFEARRDTAIIRVGIDCGLRRAEFAWLALEDVDITNRVLSVKGKGGHLATVYIGARTAQALDRYIRTRSRHPKAEAVVERTGVGGERQRVHPLFLSARGGLTPEGVHDMVQRRAAQAGIARKVTTHQLRHHFADALKSAGASDEDVMRLGRWRDPRIMRRYASSAADRRAQATHARLSPGDRL